MRNRSCLVAVLVLSVCLPGRNAPAAEDALTSQFDGIFSPLADDKSPGVAVLVRKDGRTVFARGYGARELRTLAKIDARTNFRLASCSKQFTAMSVMLLVHDGKLRYEEKLTDVFPDFPAYGKAINIRHLLNHTSGLPDYEDLMTAAEKRNGAAIWSETRQIGLVVAKVSGKPFGQFLRERIFAPLGMMQTLAYEKGKSEVSRRAYGHSKESDGWKETDQSSTSATLGDGRIYSSLEDLAKWDEALAKHTLLSEAEMQAALIPAKLADGSQPKWPANSDRPEGTPVAYGFGWFLDPYRRHSRMWHYGDTMGFHTYIVRFVSDNLTIIVLCNRTDLDPEALALKVADDVLR